MPAHGRTDKNTLQLQDTLRMLERTNKEQYNRLNSILAQYGYKTYHNSRDILMVYKPKDVTALKYTEVTERMNSHD